MSIALVIRVAARVSCIERSAGTAMVLDRRPIDLPRIPRPGEDLTESNAQDQDQGGESSDGKDSKDVCPRCVEHEREDSCDGSGDQEHPATGPDVGEHRLQLVIPGG